MKLKNVKIGYQILLGIIVIIGLFLAMGYVSYNQTKRIYDKTVILYEQSLEVRTAIGHLNTNIQQMRLYTRDLMLTTSQKEKEEILFLMEKASLNAELMFQKIMKGYLGPQKDIDEAFELYLQWKIERNKNTKLAKAGDISKIKKSVANTGNVGSKREQMLMKINVIDETEKKIGDDIFKNSKVLLQKLNLQLVLFITFAILLTIVIYALFIFYIRNPLKRLTKTTLEFSKGNYKIRNQYHSENEIGELSDAFNLLAQNIELTENISLKTNLFSEDMVLQDDAKEFFKLTLQRIMENTNSQIAAVYILNEQKFGFQLYFSIGMDQASKDYFSMDDFEGEFSIPTITKKINHIKDLAQKKYISFSTTFESYPINEIITVPIVNYSEVIAIISLGTIHQFDPISIQFIEKIHHSYSARIEGVLAFRRIRKIAEDLQKEKENLSKLSAYNRCLIEASLDPFVTIDLDGKISDFNHATELITGCSREQLIGTDFSLFFTDYEKANKVYKRVFKEGFIRDYELAIKNMNGTITPVNYNATIFKDDNNKSIGVFAVARDVSEQKMIQEKLIEANRLKTSFLSNMSHELRTPLNSVIALSGVLSRKLENKIDEEDFSYLEVIQRNGKNLLSLINELLDISRIESGKEEINITEFKLCESVNEVIELIRPQIMEKQLILDATKGDCSILMKTDENKVKHIFQNIIGNAVKFTEKGEIIISATRVGQFVEISVKDSGIGISSDNFSKIFEEFRQADTGTSRMYGGTGLGLTIAKKYAELLGGSISVQSEVGVGSEFIIRIPILYNYNKKLTEDQKLDRSLEQ